MIFSRKKKDSSTTRTEEVAAVGTDQELAAVEQDEATAPAAEQPAGQTEASGTEVEVDEWSQLDASRNWREDGPFDITEVDLDADEISRIDLGVLVLTPFDGMQLQLQVDQQTNKVQAVLVLAEQSGIEIALFASPSHTSLLPQIRAEMLAATEQAQGQASLAEGPFGTEVRRVIPMQGPDGDQVFHISRTWFTEGPNWLLRGVLIGQAGMGEKLTGVGELLLEFYSNLVVRRGSDPRVPGELIPMNIPESLVQQDQG